MNTCSVMRMQLIAALLAGASAPAFAQAERAPAASESNLDGADIVVTARRRDEKLQDVPQVISVVSGQDLQKRGIMTVADLQFSTPGVQVTPSSRSNSTPAFTIRGMRQADVSMTTDPSVGIYFADVPVARPNGFSGSMFDLASVQTLKGPQGTLFGRNTVGGAILFTPNAPTEKFEGSLQLQAGNYNLKDIEGVINIPVSPAVGLRVSGKLTRRDGYMINKALGSFNRDANDLHGEGLRVFLRIRPSDSITSDTIGTYSHSDDHGTAVKLIQADPTRLPIPALRPSFAAATAAALALGDYEFINQPFVNLDGSKSPTYSKVDAKSIQNTTSVNLSDTIMVKNIIGYRKVSSSGTYDLSGAEFNTVRTNAFFNAHQFSEELQLQGKGPELNWIIGGFYFREKGEDGAPSNQFSPRVNFSSNARAENSNRSVFGHFDYSPEFAHGLTLAAGVRYNNDKRTTWAKPRTPITVGGVNGYRCTLEPLATRDHVPSVNGEECTEVRKDASYSKVTYDVTLSYKISPQVMAYAAHRRGYRSGAVFGRPASLAAFNIPTAPETVNDFELGLKSEFDVSGLRGRLNVAYYHANYKNAQRTVSQIIDGTLGSVYLNAGTAKIDGVDVDAMLRVTPNFTLNASYAYINARYTEFNDTIAGGTKVDVSDSDFDYTPEHVFTASARYVVPMAVKSGELALMATYYHQSAFDTNPINTTNCAGGLYANCVNNAGSRLPGYGLLNLRVDWDRVFGSPFDVALFMNNVTNKYYYIAGQTQLSNFGVNTVTPGAPRMFGAQMRVHF